MDTISWNARAVVSAIPSPSLDATAIAPADRIENAAHAAVEVVRITLAPPNRLPDRHHTFESRACQSRGSFDPSNGLPDEVSPSRPTSPCVVSTHAPPKAPCMNFDVAIVVTRPRSHPEIAHQSCRPRWPKLSPHPLIHPPRLAKTRCSGCDSPAAPVD